VHGSAGMPRRTGPDGKTVVRILSAVLVKSLLLKKLRLHCCRFFSLLRFASLAFRLSQYVIDRLANEVKNEGVKSEKYQFPCISPRFRFSSFTYRPCGE